MEAWYWENVEAVGAALGNAEARAVAEGRMAVIASISTEDTKKSRVVERRQE